MWKEGLRQHLPWWSEGYDGKAKPQPSLSISGRRLDGPALPMRTDDNANGGYIAGQPWFIMTGMNFPTTGCWEITGRYQAAEVKFVVWVGPLPE